MFDCFVLVDLIYQYLSILTEVWIFIHFQDGINHLNTSKCMIKLLFCMYFASEKTFLHTEIFGVLSMDIT